MARFGQGLIRSLTNPAYGQGLFEAGQALGSAPGEFIEQRRAEREEKEALQANAQLLKTAQQGVAAAQLGDVSAVSAQIRKLQAAQKVAATPQQQLAISKRIEQLQAAMPTAQQTALTNKAKAVFSIDQELKNESINPQLQSVLQQRKADLLQDQDVQAAYNTAKSANAKASADAYLKSQQIAEAKQKQAVSAVFDGLVQGADREQLEGKVPASILKSAVSEYEKYLESVDNTEKLLNKTTDFTRKDISNLLPEQQEAVLNAQRTTGRSSASALIKKFTESNAIADTQKRLELSEQAQQADINSAALAFLTQDSKTEGLFGGGDQDIQEYYKDLEGEDDKETLKLQQEFQQETAELMALAIESAREGGMSGEELSNYVINYVGKSLKARYGIEGGSFQPVESPSALLNSEANSNMSAREAALEWLRGQE